MRAAAAHPAFVFTDGDSVLPLLVAGSLAVGQEQDWALSPVLFVPETAVFGLAWLLGLGPPATLAVSGVLHHLALYGAFRVVAGRRGAGRMPVLAASAAVAVFGLLSVLEPDPRDGGLALASLLVAVTYYWPTVVGAVLAVGLIRRFLDAPRTRTLVALGPVAAVSAFDNPLFVLWAVAPAALALVVAARRPAFLAAGVLVVASAAGYLARTPFADHIVAASGNYFRLERAGDSARHYADVVSGGLASASGIAWLVVVAALLVLPWFLRRGDAGMPVRTAFIGPPLVLVAAILLGTDATRYLQPLVFLPLAALAAAPLPAVVLRTTAAVAASLVVVLAVAALAAPTARDDADIACVVDWIEQSDGVGAGQFWAVRGPKAYLEDPSQLIQVDHELRPYEWLVNRADVDGRAPSFLVLGDRDTPYAVDTTAATRIPCGSYTILDFGPRTLPLSIPRS